MERALLIYNPTAGKEAVSSRLDKIISILEKEGFAVVPYATGGPGDATRKASQDSMKYETIIAAGGDGTLHEIINGLGQRPSSVKLGIIPTGTSNDFARALQIPPGIEEAARIIGQRKTQEVDLGIINDRLFINIAGGGVLTHISYAVPSKLKTYLGQLAYYAKSLEELPRLRPVHVRISTPEVTIEEDIMLFLTANSRSVGGFEHLAPRASLNDGLLDLIVVKRLNLGEFIHLAAKCLSGDHINHPKIIYLQTSKVEVSSKEKVSLNADGEYAGVLPCTINVLPKHVIVFTP